MELNLVLLVNLGVNIAVATGLWLVWTYNKTQRFVRHLAIMVIANPVASIGFIALKGDLPYGRWLGSLVIGASIAVVAISAICAVHDMLGRTPDKRVIKIASLVILAFFTLCAFFENYILFSVVNSIIWFGIGGVATWKFWVLGWSDRLVGIFLFALGINAFNLALYGEEGVIYLYAFGTVLRAASGIAIVNAALRRSLARSESTRNQYESLTANAPLGVIITDGKILHYTNSNASALFCPAANYRTRVPEGAAAATGDIFNFIAPQVRDLLGDQNAIVDIKREVINNQDEVKFLRLIGWKVNWNGLASTQWIIVDETEQHLINEENQALLAKNERQRIEFAEQNKLALIKTNAELEQRVAERTQELQIANLVKNQFLSNISHELRTPMNAVLGLIQLLQGTGLTELQHEYSTKAARSGNLLVGLINDLLDFSKIEAGQMELELAPFDFEHLLHDISKAVSALAQGKPIEILFDFDETLPSSAIGDAGRLQQVLLNIISNAVKFSHQGEIVISFKKLNCDDNNLNMRVSVADTGIGIAQDQLDHIFAPFSQAESSITRRFGGSGLGLTISRHLLHLMGTDVQVQSTLGVGSTFSFELSLPVNDAARPTGINFSHKQCKLDVLIVDDNHSSLTLLHTLISGFGCTTTCASAGDDAIAKVKQRLALGASLFDSVVLDWRMQPMDGWQVMRAIRALYPAGKAPAFIFISGNERDALTSIDKADQESLSAYLVKPITSAALFGALTGGRQIRTTPRIAPPKPHKTTDRVLEGIRILVVEDTPLNQLVARELLTVRGGIVRIVANGALGVQELEKAPNGYDIVLMDMQMPVMDGCTAAREIRTRLGLTELPIIALTANTSQADRDACAAAGMDGYVGKPFDAKYLTEVVLNALK